MFSKGFVYVLACVALCQSIELPSELQEYVEDLHKICVTKSGISEDDHAAYDVKTNPHDPKLQCYMKCLMLEAKWMNPQGDIQYDFIIDTSHPQIKDLLVAAINKCRAIDNGANLCEKASNFNFCMYDADPVNWFLI
uniref:Odorant binding protein 17 n=1 Tax=Colaphellus bowringi TaxID=561076 RepID=A0A0S3J2P2_9CUCU|nr:odorant binding protein 17 [Colaphellus bowringi]